MAPSTSIEGGMEMLPRHLAAGLTRTRVELDSAVVQVSRARDDRYLVTTRRARRIVPQEFDAVVIALPYNRLQAIEWAGERLRRAMAKHVAHYDRPGHYLRVSILFDRPFWQHLMTGSWVMLDAFGGCCLYDETSVPWCGNVWRVGLAAGGRRRAVILQHRRSGADCGRARVAARWPLRRSTSAGHRRQGASLGRGGERAAGGFSLARRELGASTGTGGASGIGRGWRLLCSIRR